MSEPATVCPSCHHLASCCMRFDDGYPAQCCCSCHDVADHAPTLLAALLRMVDTFQMRESGPGDYAALQQAHKAISLAKGAKP